MTTVYAVATGEYSDYQIVAVYADEAHAELHVQITDDRYPCVEEWELLTDPPRSVETTYRDVNVDTQGNITGDSTRTTTDVQNEPSPLRIDDYPTRQYTSGDGFTGWRIYGSATDVEHLNKAIADRVGKIRAQLAGL